MSLQPLDLSKLSYPKPTPPSIDSLNPRLLALQISAINIMPRYQNELAQWSTHQAQIQAVSQELTTAQQKMNDKYSILLGQYEEMQKELIAEKESHAKETQEIQRLKTNMLSITKILHEILKETEAKQENTNIKNNVTEITRILSESLTEDKK